MPGDGSLGVSNMGAVLPPSPTGPVGLSQCWRALRSLEGCGRRFYFFISTFCSLCALCTAELWPEAFPDWGHSRLGSQLGVSLSRGTRARPGFKQSLKP